MQGAQQLMVGKGECLVLVGFKLHRITKKKKTERFDDSQEVIGQKGQ